MLSSDEEPKNDEFGLINRIKKIKITMDPRIEYLSSTYVKEIQALKEKYDIEIENLVKMQKEKIEKLDNDLELERNKMMIVNREEVAVLHNEYKAKIFQEREKYNKTLYYMEIEYNKLIDEINKNFIQNRSQLNHKYESNINTTVKAYKSLQISFDKHKANLKRYKDEHDKQKSELLTIRYTKINKILEKLKKEEEKVEKEFNKTEKSLGRELHEKTQKLINTWKKEFVEEYIKIQNDIHGQLESSKIEISMKYKIIEDEIFEVLDSEIHLYALKCYKRYFTTYYPSVKDVNETILSEIIDLIKKQIFKSNLLKSRIPDPKCINELMKNVIAYISSGEYSDEKSEKNDETTFYYWLVTIIDWEMASKDKNTYSIPQYDCKYYIEIKRIEMCEEFQKAIFLLSREQKRSIMIQIGRQEIKFA